MSYRVGISTAVAMVMGVEPTEPCIVCDGCGRRRTVYSKRGGAPAKWFIVGKPAPRWALVPMWGERGRDYCPACKDSKLNEAAP